MKTRAFNSLPFDYIVQIYSIHKFCCTRTVIKWTLIIFLTSEPFSCMLTKSTIILNIFRHEESSTHSCHKDMNANGQNLVFCIFGKIMKQKAFPDSNPAPQPLHNHVAELGAGQDVEAHVDRSLSISEKENFVFENIPTLLIYNKSYF